MVKSITSAAVLGLVIATAACAPTAPLGASSPARQCFRAQDVNGFTAVNDRQVNLRVGVSDIWRLDLFARCPDVDWSLRLGIESRGSSWICSGLDATIIAPSPIGPQRCAVQSLRKLTPQEVEALEPKAKP